MNSRLVSRYVLCVVAALCLGLSPIGAQQSQPRASSGGSTTPSAITLPAPAGYTQATAFAVNNDEWVAGNAMKSGSDTWPVVWIPQGSGGWSATVLTTSRGRVWAFNDAGQAAGELYPNGCCTPAVPFVATPQGSSFVVEVLPLTLPDGTAGLSGSVRSIDDNGTVLGQIDTGHPVLWRKGTSGWAILRYLDYDCPSLPDYHCHYSSLSRNGAWMGGTVEPTSGNPGGWNWPAVWSVSADGSIGPLDLLESSALTKQAPAGEAWSVNDVGHAAGWAYNCQPSIPRTCPLTSRFWGDAAPIELIPTTGDSDQTAAALGLSSSDEIVGWAAFAVKSSFERGPAYWRNPAAKPVKLGLPKGTSYSTTRATGINDYGLVVGYGSSSFGGKTQAIAWRVR